MRYTRRIPDLAATSYRQLRLFTHALSAEQRAQLDRAVGQFHAVQKVLRLVPGGERELVLHDNRVELKDLLAAPAPDLPEITVTGARFVDDWFTHTHVDRALLNVGGWVLAFVNHQDLPPYAPDAYILASIALVSFLLCCRCVDTDALHAETTGCLSDLCLNRPDRVLKMRSGYICSACKTRAAAAGVSSIVIDAIQAVLDRVRLLTLGRSPQTELPSHDPDGDAEFIATAELPPEVRLPSRLIEAAREGRLTLCIGSGLSLQRDVVVEYRDALEWSALPRWGEVPRRLAALLKRYRERDHSPRPSESLEEFLADLDFFRTALGDRAYYPRAIFDIFAPVIRSPGRANRLVYRLPLRCVLTTNYDFVLNVAAPPGTAVYTWREARQAREYVGLAGHLHPPLLKIHGCASRPDTVVLTRSEYQAMRQWDEYRSLMSFVFDVQTVLFIGFGFTDPYDLDLALEQASLAGGAQGEKFALIPSSSAGAIREKRPNVQVIAYDKHDDLARILAVLVRQTTG